jgi:hypothetical protein
MVEVAAPKCRSRSGSGSRHWAEDQDREARLGAGDLLDVAKGPAGRERMAAAKVLGAAPVATIEAWSHRVLVGVVWPPAARTAPRPGEAPWAQAGADHLGALLQLARRSTVHAMPQPESFLPCRRHKEAVDVEAEVTERGADVKMLHLRECVGHAISNGTLNGSSLR